MLIAFNKPYGVLSQFTPEPGSRWRTLAEFGLPAKVYAIGRLDADSEGLLLLSDEPGWNARLLEPRHAHEREYWVQVERIPTSAALDQLAAVHEPTTVRTQAQFLALHGIDDLVAEGRRVWAESAHVGDLAALRARSRVREAEALTDASGLGGFTVVEWVRR